MLSPPQLPGRRDNSVGEWKNRKRTGGLQAALVGSGLACVCVCVYVSVYVSLR